MRCRSLKVDGNRCTRLIKGFGKYCTIHSKCKLPKDGVKGIVKQLKRERVKKGKYKTLTGRCRDLVRNYYKNQIQMPTGNNLKDLIWMDLEENEIAKGPPKLVVGDHGAYLEFKEDQMVLENLQTKPGQEWRSKNNKFVKYLHLETPGKFKVYHQLKTVKYANYKPGRYYIHPKFVRYCTTKKFDARLMDFVK